MVVGGVVGCWLMLVVVTLKVVIVAAVIVVSVGWLLLVMAGD